MPFAAGTNPGGRAYSGGIVVQATQPAVTNFSLRRGYDPMPSAAGTNLPGVHRLPLILTKPLISEPGGFNVTQATGSRSAPSTAGTRRTLPGVRAPSPPPMGGPCSSA